MTPPLTLRSPWVDDSYSIARVRRFPISYVVYCVLFLLWISLSLVKFWAECHIWDCLCWVPPSQKYCTNVITSLLKPLSCSRSRHSLYIIHLSGENLGLYPSFCFWLTTSFWCLVHQMVIDNLTEWQMSHWKGIANLSGKRKAMIDKAKKTRPRPKAKNVEIIKMGWMVG